MKRVLLLLPALIFAASAASAADAPRGNTQFESFSQVKKILLNQVFNDHRTTIYCGASFTPDKQVNEVTRQERHRLVKLCKDLTCTVKKLRDFPEAIVTGGGISVKAINPATMELKEISHLFAAGELIDVDSVTGGYNLQVAWSTGYLAGISVY